MRNTNNYVREKLLYEGKAKKLYSLKGKRDILLQEFKDDAAAFNALKKGTIENKGVINNQITDYVFRCLQKKSIFLISFRILDKYRFRFDPGRVNETYVEVRDRICLN